LRRYFREVLNVDPDDIWLHLYLGLEEAKLYYRAFLRAYVQDSERKFLILGPPEYEYRLTVTAAATVTERWRQLITMADSRVLLEKRQQDPANKDLWRLKYMDHTKQRGQGPVFEISKVSRA